MREAKKAGERTGQRRRTRKAIVQAAMDLLARTGSPSIADVAAAADVSRRTVYMYFPTLDQLLTDAALGLATEPAFDRMLAPSMSTADMSRGSRPLSARSSGCPATPRNSAG